MGYHRELEIGDRIAQEDAQAGHPRCCPAATTASPGSRTAATRTDLEYFVKYLGFTPMEAIVAATKLGGQIMMRGRELGQVKEG